MPKAEITNRTDLFRVVADRALTNYTGMKRTRVEETPSIRERGDLPPLSNRSKVVSVTRAEPLAEQNKKACNKARPTSHRGDGSGRKFAGRYCGK